MAAVLVAFLGLAVLVVLAVGVVAVVFLWLDAATPIEPITHTTTTPVIHRRLLDHSRHFMSASLAVLRLSASAQNVFAQRTGGACLPPC